MSIIKRIPANSRYLDTLSLFTGTFNAPTVGRYDFGSVAANNNVLVLPMLQNAVYMIAQVGFSATVPESSWLEAISTEPKVLLKKTGDGMSLYSRPIPLVGYTAGNEAVVFYWSTHLRDTLTASFQGVLTQPASLVAVASIRAQVSVRIYEIVAHEWVKRFKRNMSRTI